MLRDVCATRCNQNVGTGVHLVRRTRRIISLAPRHEEHETGPGPSKQHAIAIQPKTLFLRVSCNLPSRRTHHPGQPTLISPDQVAPPTQARIIQLEPLAPKLAHRSLKRAGAAEIREGLQEPVADGVQLI